MFSSSKNLFQGRKCPSITAGTFCRLLCCPFDHPERVKREGEGGSEEGERVKRRKLDGGEGVTEKVDKATREKLETAGSQQDLNQPDRLGIEQVEGDLVKPMKDGEMKSEGNAAPNIKEKTESSSQTTAQTSGSQTKRSRDSNGWDQGSRSEQQRSTGDESRDRTKSPASQSRDPMLSRDIQVPSRDTPQTSSASVARAPRPKSALDVVKAGAPKPAVVSASRDMSRDPSSTSRDPTSTPRDMSRDRQSSDSDHLLPTTIFPCPATLPQRIAYLKAIHTALTEKRKLKFPKRAAILEELGAAKRSGGQYMVYTNECRVLVKSIKDGTWRGGGGKKIEEKKSNTMNSSVSHQLSVLASKLKPLLAQNGYPVNPDAKKSGLPSNIGIQHCDRCNKAFDVPKVDNYGRCKYHWARPRQGGNSNMPEKFYPCCNQPVGMSEGCEEAPRHVYKLHDLNDLAFVIPFRRVSGGSSNSSSTAGTTSGITSASSNASSNSATTSRVTPGTSRPTPSDARRPRTVFNGPAVAQREPEVTLENMKHKKETSDESRDLTSAVALDCEMVYTSLGMELCRVTCIDYNGKKTLDRVVRPTGRILDYNTRFSGISDINEPIITETGEKGSSVSFEEAHRLLGELIDKETVLVGHGLENDLITLRLIHDKVIDTSILYPTFNPRFKTSLKNLALKYLKRDIQTGEHDSMEDALAALDVVKCHLKG